MSGIVLKPFITEACVCGCEEVCFLHLSSISQLPHLFRTVWHNYIPSHLLEGKYLMQLFIVYCVIPSVVIKVKEKSHFKKRKCTCVSWGGIFLSVFNSDTKVQKHPYPGKSFLGSQKNQFARTGL